MQTENKYTFQQHLPSSSVIIDLSGVHKRSLLIRGKALVLSGLGVVPRIEETNIYKNPLQLIK